LFFFYRGAQNTIFGFILYSVSVRAQQLYTEAQINFGDRTPYLTYEAQGKIQLLVYFLQLGADQLKFSFEYVLFLYKASTLTAKRLSQICLSSSVSVEYSFRHLKKLNTIELQITIKNKGRVQKWKSHRIKIHRLGYRFLNPYPRVPV
jgi:hypothetical protein